MGILVCFAVDTHVHFNSHSIVHVDICKRKLNFIGNICSVLTL